MKKENIDPLKALKDMGDEVIAYDAMKNHKPITLRYHYGSWYKRVENSLKVLNIIKEKEIDCEYMINALKEQKRIGYPTDIMIFDSLNHTGTTIQKNISLKEFYLLKEELK